MDGWSSPCCSGRREHTIFTFGSGLERYFYDNPSHGAHLNVHLEVGLRMGTEKRIKGVQSTPVHQGLHETPLWQLKTCGHNRPAILQLGLEFIPT